jgi:hypothetical protein
MTRGSGVAPFGWYDEQLHDPLPNEVNQDPDKLFVNVQRAIADTDALEGAGDVEQGTTVGFDAYGIVNVPIDKGLETALFYCGKPVGEREGDTYPLDTVFTSSRCTIREKWGAGNYLFSSSQSGEGVIKDLHDDYTVLVRGSAADGYAAFSSFFGPTAGFETATDSHISILLLKASADGGATELRHSLRRTGQSYAFLGIDFGRKNFGFNVSRIHCSAALPWPAGGRPAG